VKQPLWIPSPEWKAGANVTRFMNLVNDKHNLKLDSYQELYRWSIDYLGDFWAAVWDFGEIKASRGSKVVVDDLSKLPGAQWFPEARLNYAENLLRFRDDNLAFIFKGENQKSARMTYAELYDNVARLAKSLREMGVQPKDRVAAYMPNLIETAVAMLAASSIGAVWSSCASDIGPQAALDRLGQIGPKVLFAADGYFYKGKVHNSLPNVKEVAAGISSLEKVVIVPYTEARPEISAIPGAINYTDFISSQPGLEIRFEQLPFNHPLVIMFSSGTTGKPKCLVQGAGGVLINQVKEQLLSTDLKREDRIFYITTCSWMMWNWLLSALAIGATVVLYDGNPNYPDAGAMWQFLEKEKITVFGTSASFIQYQQSQGMRPREEYDLSFLKEIVQTGSALSAAGFEYLYREVKTDLYFNSISGGTDINGCFAGGNPISPVYAGELQGPALGMKIAAYDEQGHPVYDQQGELVCEAPAPSMPLYFWDDPDNQKYHRAYFDVYPNVWRHGDYILIHSDTGGITFYGRSDSVLKPSGVRIGTAEIYNQVETLPEITDSLAIGQNWRGDQRIILFVKMAEGVRLTEEIKAKIKLTLRQKASPRHVPALIFDAPDIPYTLNGKKVESAVTNIVNGRAVTNRDALANPEALDYYQKILPELQTEA